MSNEIPDLDNKNEKTRKINEKQRELSKCYTEMEETVKNIGDLKEEIENETSKERIVQLQKQTIELYEKCDMLRRKEYDINLSISSIEKEQE
ncbi:MAG: hypothetical protein KAI71_06515 [Candidatus Pacebacteria bacterium]|nr:hypothetical protein [Candidatus Paceibacterota bacterium]